MLSLNTILTGISYVPGARVAGTLIVNWKVVKSSTFSVPMNLSEEPIMLKSLFAGTQAYALLIAELPVFAICALTATPLLPGLTTLGSVPAVRVISWPACTTTPRSCGYDLPLEVIVIGRS
ncbi:Uncharacterised protein [uncultured archaeon]|nr:Uncharacterised protein [uncultured archaeon]